MIELSNVTFHYSVQEEQDVSPALRDVNVVIREGETLAIIGHNGSGKSTLTKLLAAILLPHRGSILVDGLDAARSRDELWEIRQRVGVVFQNPDDQLIASTVIDEIAFGPENLVLSPVEIEERVQEVLSLLQLGPFAHMSINELSMSLKQRVAIASVLAMRPRYLVLDEPTAMVSGETARQLLRTLHNLARTQGIAVIHVTHFMYEIADFDRVIVLDAGSVLMDGTPAEVFARVDELRAAGLDVPMVTHLGKRLAAQGWPRVPQVVLTPEQLLDAAGQHIAARGNAANEPMEPGLTSPGAQAAEEAHQTSQQELVPGDEKALFTLQHLFYTHQRGTPFAQAALRDLTLALPAGQFIGLVGPTGSGKSTLLDILAGLLRPHAGMFLFAGKDTSAASFRLESIRERVGVVFQAPDAQIFEETVGKDVSFGPRQKKVALAESRRLVQEALEAVGLPYEDFRTRYTYALSGGEKRRVAIAGVLALQPEVLLFDEPMAGLDPRGRGELFNLLVSLKRRGDLTIIYATSSLRDVIELADTIHVLDRGQQLFSGTPREIVARAEALHELDIALPEAAQLALALRQGVPGLRVDMLDLAELEAELQKLSPAVNAPGEDAALFSVLAERSSDYSVVREQP